MRFVFFRFLRLLCFLLCGLPIVYRIAFVVRNVVLRVKYAKAPLDGHLLGSCGGGGECGCGGGVEDAVASAVVIVDSALPGLLFFISFRHWFGRSHFGRLVCCCRCVSLQVGVVHTCNVALTRPSSIIDCFPTMQTIDKETCINHTGGRALQFEVFCFFD